MDNEKEIQAELNSLFESDVKEFSRNGAYHFGKYLRFSENETPQARFEVLMRYSPKGEPIYKWDPEVAGPTCWAAYIPHYNGAANILFGVYEKALSKFTRAHEMCHKITHSYICPKDSDIPLTQLIGLGELQLTQIDSDGKQVACPKNEKGTALNEGATNLIAEKLSGENYVDGMDKYGLETSIARQLISIVGEDTFFSAVFRSPNILRNKVDNIAGKGCYDILITSLDKYRELDDEFIKDKNNVNIQNQRNEIMKSMQQGLQNLKLLVSNVKAM